MPNNTLKIKEIFFSIQGESATAGIPSIFIRLTGCPLRCQYCDTAYAFHGGSNLTISEIASKIAQYPTKYICVTGGEPLAQKNCIPLIDQLIQLGYQVSIETSGAIDISQVNDAAMIVMDLKTPGSGEQHKNIFANIDHLKPSDQVKFVICSKDDYNWTKEVIHKYSKLQHIECLLSPSCGQTKPRELAEWILSDGLKVRMQIQMHKTIWGDEPGR